MISPESASTYALQVAELYRDAELRILAAITASVADGLGAPDWELLQLGRLQQVRAVALRELNAANAEAAQLIAGELNAAYAAGGASVFADVGEHLDVIKASTLQQQAAVKAYAKITADALREGTSAVLRHVPDVYQQIIARTTAAAVTGTTTREEVAQAAIREFVGRGLSGVVTKRGTMDIATYATMAIRTAVARTILQGHADTMQANNLDLVVIHPGPRACSICDRWARKILTLGHTPEGDVEVANLAGPGTITVHVDGSLADARAGGWGHPNCRCNLAAYIPGVSKPTEIKRPPWDATAYAAQQQQRGIERQIRGWKTAAANSIDPAAKREALQRVASWQQAQRDLLKAHPYLKRQSQREQVGTLGAGTALR